MGAITTKYPKYQKFRSVLCCTTASYVYLRKALATNVKEFSLAQVRKCGTLLVQESCTCLQFYNLLIKIEIPFLVKRRGRKEELTQTNSNIVISNCVIYCSKPGILVLLVCFQNCSLIERKQNIRFSYSLCRYIFVNDLQFLVLQACIILQGM